MFYLAFPSAICCYYFPFKINLWPLGYILIFNWKHLQECNPVLEMISMTRLNHSRMGIWNLKYIVTWTISCKFYFKCLNHRTAKVSSCLHLWHSTLLANISYQCIGNYLAYGKARMCETSLNGWLSQKLAWWQSTYNAIHCDSISVLYECIMKPITWYKLSYNTLTAGVNKGASASGTPRRPKWPRMCSKGGQGSRAGSGWGPYVRTYGGWTRSRVGVRPRVRASTNRAALPPVRLSLPPGCRFPAGVRWEPRPLRQICEARGPVAPHTPHYLTGPPPHSSWLVHPHSLTGPPPIPWLVHPPFHDWSS